jgi:hypothetical protein
MPRPGQDGSGGVLLDLPGVVAEAEPLLRAAGLEVTRTFRLATPHTVYELART